MKTLYDSHFILSSISFLICFTVFTFMQIWWPHHKNIRSDFKNWRVNLPLAIFNSGVMSFTSTYFLMPIFSRQLNQLNYENLQMSKVIFSILASILVLDFLSYFLHLMNHRLTFLWRFHIVHHSDRNFDTSTAVRFHFVELLISFVVRLAVIQTLGLPFIGFFAYEILFQFFNIFEHGNISLPPAIESAMAKVFVTPALHRKHHSIEPQDLNSNFGTIFSFWDRLGRTFIPGASSEHFQVGLPESNLDWSFVETLVRPLVGPLTTPFNSIHKK